MKFLQCFRTLSSDELRAQQLEQARVDLLTHAHRREYHAAMEAMLRDRIGRLGAALRPMDAAAERTRQFDRDSNPS